MRDRPRTPLLVSAEVQGTAKLLTEREMATCSGLGFESLDSPELLAGGKSPAGTAGPTRSARSSRASGRRLGYARSCAARLLAFPETKPIYYVRECKVARAPGLSSLS